MYVTNIIYNYLKTWNTELKINLSNSYFKKRENITGTHAIKQSWKVCFLDLIFDASRVQEIQSATLEVVERVARLTRNLSTGSSAESYFFVKRSVLISLAWGLPCQADAERAVNAFLSRERARSFFTSPSGNLAGRLLRVSGVLGNGGRRSVRAPAAALSRAPINQGWAEPTWRDTIEVGRKPVSRTPG